MEGGRNLKRFQEANPTREMIMITRKLKTKTKRRKLMSYNILLPLINEGKKLGICLFIVRRERRLDIEYWLDIKESILPCRRATTR